MRNISWDEVLREIELNPEINFISEVMTPLHALGVESFLVKLKENGIQTKGYILVVPHPETGTSLTEEMFHKDFCNDQ